MTTSMKVRRQLQTALSIVACCAAAGGKADIQGSPDALVTSPPESLLAYLQADSGYGHCAADELLLLRNEAYFAMEDFSLVLFLGLPDYMCSHSNSFIPVSIDPQGRWQWGERMQGAPSLVVEESPRRYWLSTQYQIEGTYPTLYTSKDGLHWSEVALPSLRDIDCCFEYLTQIAFDADNIYLRFEGGSTGKRATWRADRAGLLAHPKWELVSNHHAIDWLDENVTQTDRGWQRQQNAEVVHFYHPSQAMAVEMPLSLRAAE